MIHQILNELKFPFQLGSINEVKKFEILPKIYYILIITKI